MDESRFDDMTKTFGALTSRRLTVGALLGGALGRLGLAKAEAKKGQRKDTKAHGSGGKGGDRKPKRQDTEAEAKSGNCIPACNECNTCQKGKCKKKNGKKKCQKGTCLPKATGTTCTVSPGIPGTCQSGTCLPQCSTAATCPAPPAGQLCAVAACVAGQCQFSPKPAGSPCRAATGECDTAEVCNGTSLDCPANTFKPAGTPCTADPYVCTNDICSGSSAICTHPAKCTGTNSRCCAGTCCPNNGKVCSGNLCCKIIGSPCTSGSTNECCNACAFNFGSFSFQCT